MLYTDIRSLKKILEVADGDTSEDIKFHFLIEYASRWIDELLGGRELELKARTEFYGGTGTQALLLRHRPVFTTPTIRVWTDPYGYFGQVDNSFTAGSELTYGTDFVLRVDQNDGSSRSGILLRVNSLWERPGVRTRGYLTPYVGDGFGNVKVTYTAGFTPDTLPAQIRLACNILVARMREMLPLGYELASESYEERALTKVVSDRQKLLALVSPLVLPFRNHKFN